MLRKQAVVGTSGWVAAVIRAFRLAAFLVLGCAAPSGHVYSNSEHEQGDRRVGQFISSQWSFNTSSFWIEGPEGLILIDAQFLPTAVQKEINFAERATGKKAVLAIVLHPNPDRVNGTSYLQERGIRVVTSEQVRELIPAIHERWSPAFFEKYRYSSYPRTLTVPESFGGNTQELSAGGITIKAHVLGAGCSQAHVVVEWEGHLFVGDLVANRSHGWFENGRVDEWLKRLDELRALRPKWIHPGHGFTGGPELLDQQAEYLNTVTAAVAAEEPRGLSTSEAMARITSRVIQRHPDRAHQFFLPPLLRAEWVRQAARSAAP
jgi:glyoxylase-like metal-dependent hydrolase (beta-lactamase superfamily II)